MAEGINMLKYLVMSPVVFFFPKIVLRKALFWGTVSPVENTLNLREGTLSKCCFIGRLVFGKLFSQNFCTPAGPLKMAFKNISLFILSLTLSLVNFYFFYSSK